jgi:signal transduction histidine kinase
VSVVHRGGGVSVGLRGRGAAPAVVRGDDEGALRLRQRVLLHGGRISAGSALGRWWARAAVPADAVRAVDLMVLAAAAAAVAADVLAEPGDLAVQVLAGVALVLVPVGLRRRVPLTAALVLAAGHVAGVAAGLLPERPYSTGPIVVLGAASVALHAVTRAQALVGGAALVAVGVGVTALTVGDPTPATDLAIVLYLGAGAWAIGWTARSSGGAALRAQARAWREAVEHPVRRRAALEDERRRVARDLHDVVAHGVSLVAVLAGAAAATAERDPGGARERLATAAAAVAEARRELARLMMMLDVEAEREPPHPALGDLAALVDQARAGGQEVILAGVPSLPVPAGVAASAYRIVQEALTNARKHAPGAPVTVRLTGEGDELAVSVVNPIRSTATAAAPDVSGGGHGIAGMRERARLLDGRLVAQPRADDGTFVVTARLPLGTPNDAGADPVGTTPDGAGAPSVGAWTSPSPRGA